MAGPAQGPFPPHGSRSLRAPPPPDFSSPNAPPSFLPAGMHNLRHAAPSPTAGSGAPFPPPPPRPFPLSRPGHRGFMPRFDITPSTGLQPHHVAPGLGVGSMPSSNLFPVQHVQQLQHMHMMQQMQMQQMHRVHQMQAYGQVQSSMLSPMQQQPASSGLNSGVPQSRNASQHNMGHMSAQNISWRRSEQSAGQACRGRCKVDSQQSQKPSFSARNEWGSGTDVDHDNAHRALKDRSAIRDSKQPACGQARGPNSRNSCKPPRDGSRGDKVNADLEVAKTELRKLGAQLPGETPEEIERWVAARRANWPSKANVERKKAEAAARAKRGEISLTASQPSLKETVAHQRKSEKRRRREDKRFSVYAKQSIADSISARSEGLAAITQYADASSEDEDGSDCGDEGLPPPRNSVDDVVDGSADGKDGSKNSSRRPARDCARRQAKPGQNGNHGGRIRKRNSRRRNKKKQAPVRETVESITKPSLLRKLLEPEIRREQSLLVQCLRVLVEENFFTSKPVESGGAC